MKKAIKTIISLCAVGLLTFGAVACGGNDIPPDPENVLTLNVNELSLTIGDEYSLIADYTPIDGAETAFVSSNPEVASVDEYGRVVANRAGETIITVSYGELSKTCTVTVGYNGMLPTLSFEETVADNMQVGIGESINLGAYVTFNSVQYTDAVIDYTYSDDTIGAVQDGLFTPVKVGTTSVTITASWRGMEGLDSLTKTINVTAINVVEVLVNDGEANLTLYNLAVLGGNEYEVSKDFVVNAKENGVAISAEKISVEVAEGTEFVKYENGKIYGLKPGEATVLVSVQDQFGETYEERFNVTVLTSVGDYDKEILFSAYDGELPIADIFGSDIELVSAFSGEEELQINANKDGVLGLTTTKEGPSVKQITVYSDTQGWNLDLLVYSGIIDEASDLDMFYLGNDRACPTAAFTEEDTFSGYYILANDIDCTGYVFGASKETAGETPKNLSNPAGIGSTSMIGVGLTGVFDGQGYSITNFTPNGAGLFAAINGGTLKNVNISGTGSYGGGGAFLSAMMRNATLQNVQVDAGSLASYGTVGVSKFIVNSTLENCIFKGRMGTKDRTWGGLIYATADSTFTNCYAIFNRPLSADVDDNKDGVTDFDAENQTGYTTATTLLEGIKRYVDEEEMLADTTNNLTLFPKRYWDVTSGMPVWRGGFECTVQDTNGSVISDVAYLELNQQMTLKIFALGEEYATPTLSLKNDSGVIAVNGTTVRALSVGEATLEIFWTADGKEYEKTITVIVTLPVEDYSEELLFSAKDGLFFNAQGTVVSVEDIFGNGAVLTSATHATDTLTVSDGVVLGLTTNGKSAVQTYIVLFTEDRAFKVSVTAYTLVIDEASDMNMFHHGGKNPLTGGKFDDSFFTEEEDKFDGYYILVKDIDMSQSKFATAQSFRRSTYIGSSNLQNVGLTGTFDGNGYRLYNFAPTFNGGPLFSAINGTVKNVSITNDKGTGNFSFTAYFAGVIRNATIENVYVDANYDLSLSVTTDQTSPSRYVSAIVGSTFKNCIFVDKTTDADYISLAKYISGTPSFTDCYFISGAKVGQLYVDGGWKVHDASNQTATYTIAGIKRYTTLDEMAADTENTFTSFAQSGYWTVETGKTPVWKRKA